MLLCGDAAGFINPISGGGIQFAMISGENAAKVINDAYEKEIFTSSFLSKYQEIWMQEFGKDLRTFARFVNILFPQSKRIYPNALLSFIKKELFAVTFSVGRPE